MLSMDNTALVIIDVQGKLAYQVERSKQVLDNIRLLLQGFQLFELPIVVTEQYPKGLGPTVTEVGELIPDINPLEKTTFNACLKEEFLKEIDRWGKKQLLVAGVETHVCVFQTVAGLLENSYQVHVVSDAVSSRSSLNREKALERMKDLGAVITTTEMALFELVKRGEGEVFKGFIRLVK